MEIIFEELRKFSKVDGQSWINSKPTFSQAEEDLKVDGKRL